MAGAEARLGGLAGREPPGRLLNAVSWLPGVMRAQKPEGWQSHDIVTARNATEPCSSRCSLCRVNAPQFNSAQDSNQSQFGGTLAEGVGAGAGPERFHLPPGPSFTSARPGAEPWGHPRPRPPAARCPPSYRTPCLGPGTRPPS